MQPARANDRKTAGQFRVRLRFRTGQTSSKSVRPPGVTGPELHHALKAWSGYHEWMKSEELQKLTASEPLSLKQEYEMQKSWREDEDKCTFIILDKKKYSECDEETESMIGDTNIFIVDREMLVGEIEIMIAEVSARGKKLDWEALILMMLYGINLIGIKTYQAKISFMNEISLRVFKKLGFIEKSRSDVFQEITLEKKVTDEWIKWLEQFFTFEIQLC